MNLNLFKTEKNLKYINLLYFISSIYPASTFSNN